MCTRISKCKIAQKWFGQNGTKYVFDIVGSVGLFFYFTHTLKYVLYIGSSGFAKLTL